MAQPPRYDRLKDFAEDYGDNTDHAALNAELDNASSSINKIRENLVLIQRDDGRLQNGIVTPDALSPGITESIITSVSIGIEEKVQEAQQAASDASNAAALASDFASSAGVSASNAASSSNSSAASAQASEAARAAASTSATNAANSAASASNSAASASSSAFAADVSEANAAASATTAQNAEVGASNSALSASMDALLAQNAAQAAVEPVAAVVAQYLDNFIPTGQIVPFSTIYNPGGFDFGTLDAATPFPNEDAALRRASLSAGSGTFDYGLLA